MKKKKKKKFSNEIHIMAVAFEKDEMKTEDFMADQFPFICFVHYFIGAKNNATKRSETKNISARQHLTSSRVDCASVHLCQFAEHTRRTMTMIDEWWLKNSHTINLLFVADDLSAQFSSRIDSKLAQEFRMNLLQICLHARWHSDCLPRRLAHNSRPSNCSHSLRGHER